jgi:hypothetical protein
LFITPPAGAAASALTDIGDRIYMQLSDATFRRFVCATLLLCGALLWLK